MPRISRWRILHAPPASASWNMAVDTALARCAAADEGVLRIYRWTHPTLSFGRNQPAIDRYDPLAIRSQGAEVVRRPTGGREVLHDRELTYAVVVPVRALGGLRESYTLLNGALVTALRSLGVPANLVATDDTTPALGSGDCFGAPVGGEVAVNDRKIAGSAQARIGQALLQHGSLLLAPPSVGMEALRHPLGLESRASARAPLNSAELAPGGASGITLSELLPQPLGFGRVVAAVEAAMAGTLGGHWRRDELTVREREVATTLRLHYASSTWTWRS